MSFPRARIVRFNEFKPKFVRCSSNSGSMNNASDKVTGKCLPLGSSQNVAVQSLTLSRSFSELSNNSPKNSPRPHSSGDERLFTPKKSEMIENCVISKEDSEEEEFFEAPTTFKISTPVRPPAVCCTEHSNDSLHKHSLHGKLKNSGIPLYKKQQSLLSSKKSDLQAKPSNNKTMPKFNSASAKVLAQKERLPVIRCTLEKQFEIQKKKIERLKTEICAKANSLREMFENLDLLKKKLEESGKTISLEELDLDGVEMRQEQKNNIEVLKGNEEVQVDSKMLWNMNEAIKQICKFLTVKRLALVDIVERMSREPMSLQELHRNIQSLKDEKISLEKLEINESVIGCTTGSGDCLAFANQVKLLEEELSKKEQLLTKTCSELLEAQKKNEEISAASKKKISELEAKVESMEREISQNMSTHDYKNFKHPKDQEKTLIKTHIKDIEIKLKKAENKCSETKKQLGIK